MPDATILLAAVRTAEGWSPLSVAGGIVLAAAGVAAVAAWMVRVVRRR